jgi:lysyl-tRNA synthetase class 1
MRWYALDVDFEMYGKDLIESAILSSKIIKLIGKTNPSGFAYELFLDEKGEKISKSKGNGITIDQWLEYASPESLSLYMYQNPKRAKKLYKEIVSKTVDEYLDYIEKANNQNELQILMNPVWHVHNSNIPKEKMIMSFSMLLNLVETSNADSKELLWKFVKKYKKDISEKDHPIFDNLVGYALIKTLDQCNDEMKPEDIQTLIYSTGKENGYSENLREWFKLIYEVVFGDENGPRMGFFISFFGVQETKDLIINKIK